jgi:dTDP-4-amino-4,6-dideoxygalactose transaminase
VAVEALAQTPARAPGPTRTAARVGYVPALPTLWPGMLWRGPRAEVPFPFDAPAVRYFYFARNAVWMAAKVLGLQGKEVLVPAYHHGVEVEALIDAGAKVRFFRVDGRMRPDLLDLERRITPETRALYLIHYLGFPGPAERVRALADRRGLFMLEDCALALLSTDAGAPLGQRGDASIFCLYKTLPLPHGGALVLAPGRPAGLPQPQPPPLAATARHLATALLGNLELRAGWAGRWLRRGVRLLGKGAASAAAVENVATGTQHFDPAHSDLGMSPLTLRLAQAQDAAAVVAARRRNYFLLLSRLREVAPPVFSALPAGVCPLFYPLRTARPERVADALAARGVETVHFWRTGHPSCDLAEFPEVRELRRTILEIPIHQDLTPHAAAALAEAVAEAMGEVRP